MRQTQEGIEQNLAEQLCWRAARRDDSQVARLLERKQVVDGVVPYCQCRSTRGNWGSWRNLRKYSGVERTHVGEILLVELAVAMGPPLCQGQHQRPITCSISEIRRPLIIS